MRSNVREWWRRRRETPGVRVDVQVRVDTDEGIVWQTICLGDVPLTTHGERIYIFDTLDGIGIMPAALGSMAVVVSAGRSFR